MPAVETDPFAMTASRQDPPPPRARLAGTGQQEAFWGEMLRGSGDVVLEARAGTGKSTSAREAMWRQLESGGSPTIRYCCFNKAIADEFRRGCPPGVEVGTMHGFGFAALRRALGGVGGGPAISQDKTYQVLDALPGGASLKRFLRRSIARLVSLAKNHALRPDADPGDLFAALFDLVVAHDVSCWGEDERVVVRAVEVLRRSAESAATVDFDDMLWMPVILGLPMPRVDSLYIDEAQDLNPVQHELAALLNRDGRTIVIGDPYQAIYAFRGADSRSIARLRETLGARAMPLTVTWRCPASHVELARELVPDLEAAPGAAEGSIARTGDLAAELHAARPGDLVLCRANAPLVSACLKLIGMRRKAIMRGRAFGDSLLAVLRDCPADTPAGLVRALLAWEAKELDRLGRRDGTEALVEATRDKAAAVVAIAETCGSPAEVPGVIASLFDDGPAEGRVTLSSVHRAKGSEARHVRLIDLPYPPPRPGKDVPAWEAEQRRNLRYVALTRSREALVLVNP